MNVLLIGPLPDPVNGEAVANQTFINYLIKHNISHAYINTTGYQGIESSHGKFSVLKLLKFLSVYRSIPKIIDHNGVVYITIGQTFLGVIKYAPFILMANILKKPYFLHLHGNYLGHTYQSLSKINKKLFKWLIGHAQGGIVLSESLKSNFQDLLPEEKIHIVENFASDIFYNIDISGKQFQQLHILFLSNLIPEKGIEDFLDALWLLQQAGVDFKATIGGAFEISSKDTIIQKMKKIDEKSLDYKGFVNGSLKQGIFQQANVFVLPTYYKIEGQPISIIEALATGNIIVTTRQGGIPDIISEKQGFFVGKRNPDCLFKTLQHLSLNISQLAKLSQPNRQYAQGRFTEDRFGSNLLRILSRS